MHELKVPSLRCTLTLTNAIDAKRLYTIYGNYVLIRFLDAWPIFVSKFLKPCQTAQNIKQNEVSI